MNPPFFTIFTPAYNRKHLLPRVFESLRAQTCLDFEWLIVDDGSTDGTDALVGSWSGQATPFPIRYVFKKNGGKHSAHNAALELSRGYSLVTVDSDDWLLPEALSILKREWDKLPDPSAFVGVCGHFRYQDGRLVGDRFPADPLVGTPIDLRFNLKIRGDKFGSNRVDVLKKYPFPVGPSSAYVPESIVWNRIAQEFKTLFVNEVLAVKEYQSEGITDRASLNSIKNPQAYYLCYSEVLNGNVPIEFASAVRCALTVVKCSIFLKCNPFAARRTRYKLLSLLLLPAALALALRDFLRLKGLAQRPQKLNFFA